MYNTIWAAQYASKPTAEHLIAHIFPRDGPPFKVKIKRRAKDLMRVVIKSYLMGAGEMFQRGRTFRVAIKDSEENAIDDFIVMSRMEPGFRSKYVVKIWPRSIT